MFRVSHRKARRFAVWVSLTLLLCLLVAGALTGSAIAKRGPDGVTPTLSADEKALFADIDHSYAWGVMLKQVYGWGVPNYQPWWNETVAGTTASLTTVDALAAEMARIGLAPGAKNGTFIEDFPIDGREDLGSSVTIVSPFTKVISPVHEAYKGIGTGPGGVTAPVVNLGYGRWDDFEKAGDLSGKIVLLHRAEPVFYSESAVAEAKVRGAVGAITDYPYTSPDVLKDFGSAQYLPSVYVRQIEWNEIAADLATGIDIRVKLVVNNRIGNYPTAHNVVGVIPGAVYPNEYIYLACHFDHWMTAAADDSAGVGSMFAIAKAFKARQAEGWQPQRTLVFIAFDSEELGGPPDTYYDWCLGSFSHIVGQLPGGSNPEYRRTYKVWDDSQLLPAIRGERVGKIVAMLNMDVIGAKGTIVYIESTPDLTAFLLQCARDAGVTNQAKTYVYWPPSCYDDWPFYMAGVPCTEIAWWGPAYDVLYHSTGDVPAVVDPDNFRVSTLYNALALLRLDKMGVVDYDLNEALSAVNIGIANIVQKDHSVFASGNADKSALEAGMARYQAAVADASAALASAGGSPAEIARLNSIQRQAEKALQPHLFNWDSSGIPGWTGIFVFDTYANDLAAMNKAITDLKLGKAAACATDLAGVTTMGWGQDVGAEAYTALLAHMAYNPHLLWARGYVPSLTDVHREYLSLMGRQGGGMTQQEVLTSLSAKRDRIYGYVTSSSDELGHAFDVAADVLAGL
jgi:Peptidase family M28